MSFSIPVDPGNTIWTVGYVFGTIKGGASDGIPFGEMQDFSLKDDLELKEVGGASSLGAVAVGISGVKVTGMCKWLKVRANNLKQLRGGTVAFSTVTTYSRGILDEPVVFNMHLFSPADGSNAELKVFSCVSPNLNIPLAQRDFSIPDATFNCYGNGTNFWQLLLPGDQTSS